MSARISGAHAGWRRWLPKSTLSPASSKLPASPPTTFARSRTMACALPLRASRYAAPTPEGPAPRIATRGRGLMGRRSRGAERAPPPGTARSCDVLGVPDHEVEEPPQRAAVIPPAGVVLLRHRGHGFGPEQAGRGDPLAAQVVHEHPPELAPEPSRVGQLETDLLLAEDRGRKDSLHRLAHQVLLPEPGELEPGRHPRQVAGEVGIGH